MDDFSSFMRHAANRVHSTSQFTDDIEGFAFDGVDGSQMILSAETQ